MSTVTVTLDLYPARVSLPDGATISKVRATIADGELVLYIMQNGTPHEYYRRTVVSASGTQLKAAVEVEEGTVAIRKAGGCGCGDRMKSWNPWPGQVRARAKL